MCNSMFLCFHIEVNAILFFHQELSDLMSVSEAEVLESKLNELSDGASELWDVMMGLEMQLVDQLEVSGAPYWTNSRGVEDKKIW